MNRLGKAAAKRDIYEYTIIRVSVARLPDVVKSFS